MAPICRNLAGTDKRTIKKKRAFIDLFSVADLRLMYVPKQGSPRKAFVTNSSELCTFTRTKSICCPRIGQQHNDANQRIGKQQQTKRLTSSY